jgi:hypothetical protein
MAERLGLDEELLFNPAVKITLALTTSRGRRKIASTNPVSVW